MTRYEAKSRKKLIDAFIDGATIQVERNHPSGMCHEWVDDKDPSFSEHARYRIKPDDKGDKTMSGVITMDSVIRVARHSDMMQQISRGERACADIRHTTAEIREMLADKMHVITDDGVRCDECSGRVIGTTCQSCGRESK